MIKFFAHRGILLAALVGVGTLGINCSSSKKGNNVGQVTMALTLPSGVTVDSVHWTISSTSIAAVAQGDINTSDLHATASVFTSYPASMGDTVTMHAVTSAGKSCDGTSPTFSVMAGQVAMTMVTLNCGGSTPTQTQGSVDVNGSFVEGDNCPLLTSWVASPLQTSAFGGKIDVNGTATDADAADVLTFTWTATSGSFTNPSAAMTQFVCAAGGSQILTLTVSDNHSPTPCTTKIDIPVTCFTGGGGVAGAGGSGGGVAGAGGSGGGVAGAGGNGGGGGTGGGSLETQACTVCEQVEVDDANCFNTSVDGVANGCIGFVEPQRTACQALLICLRTGNGSGQNCGDSDDPVPCLCGTIPAASCGTMDPTTLPGVCRSQYIAANGGVGTGIYGAFFSNGSAVGIANNVFQCDVDMAFDPGVNCPLSVCGVQGNVTPPSINFTHPAGGASGTSGTAGASGAGGASGGSGTGGASGGSGTGGASGASGMSGVGGTVGAICGDGIVDPAVGEECEPPNTTICDANCHRVGGIAGMGGGAGTAAGAGAGGNAAGAGGFGGMGGGAGLELPCTICEVTGAADGTCFNTSVDGITNGCDGFADATQKANCEALLTCIRTGNGGAHNCGNGDDPTPCLCGTIPTASCGTMDPTTLPGVCRPQYITANGGNGTGLFGAFFSNGSPVGIANNLFQCDVDVATIDTQTPPCTLATCGITP
jgi:hypothetical protein